MSKPTRELLIALTNFGKKVEVNESSTGNFDEVLKVLEQIPEGGIVKEISDSVEWQKQQRDEW